MRGKFLLGTGLAAILLSWFLYNTDFKALQEALSQTSLLPILLACAIQSSTFAFRAWRWRLLLGIRGQTVPWISLFNIAAIGFMLNNFVPRGSGELARSYLLGRGHKTGISTTFATIVLERLFDFLTVLIILAILLVGFELPTDASGWLTQENLRFGGWAITAVTLGGAFALGLLYARASTALLLCQKLLRPFPESISKKVLALLATFIEGFSCLTSTKALLGVMLHSVLLWAFLLLSFVLVIHAFPVNLPASAPLLLLVISVFSMFIPAPGGIGSMHKAVLAGLAPFHVDAGIASAIAIVLHASGYVPVTLTGLICLRLEGVGIAKLGDITKEKENLEATP